MSKYIVIFFLIFEFSEISFSQKTSLFADNHDIKTAFNFKNGKDVFRVWDSISKHDQNYFDFISDEAWIPPLEFYYQKAIQNHDSTLAFQLQYPLAYLYHTTTKFEKCIPLLKQLACRKKKIAPHIYEMILLKLEECYIRIGELKLALDIREKRIKEGFVNHYWEIYKEAGLHNEAIKDYRMHEQLSGKGDWDVIFYYSRLGGLFKLNEQLDSAEYYYLKAHQACQKTILDTNYSQKSHYTEYVKYYMRSFMMGSIAQLYMKKKMFVKAIPLLKDDVEKSKSIAEISNAILKRLDLAECYLNLNELKIARSYIDTSSYLMMGNKIYHFDFRLFKLNADYYLKIKQFDSAAIYLNKYLILKETIDERLRKNKTDILLTILDTDKQKATVANQKLEIESIKLKEAEQRVIRSLLYGGITLLVVLLAFIMYTNLQKTKRRKEIEKSLIEKEILLKEVHHRVKNNLTTLKSLLFLQAKASDNTEVKLVLEECQLRIQSMALIHQNLYEEGGKETVEFYQFIEQLFEALKLSFNPVDTEVEVNLQSNQVSLDISLALFLGLVLNELVTNSYKYAFKNKAKGKISLNLVHENGKFVVTYYDDGIGLPNGFNETTEGFGFKLIRILTQQINAKLDYAYINHLSTFTIIIDDTK